MSQSSTQQSQQAPVYTPVQQQKIDTLNGWARKMAITTMMRALHLTMSLGAIVIGALDRFTDDRFYIQYLENNEFFKQHQRIMAEVWIFGTITQIRIKEVYGQDHPFLKMKEASPAPMNEYTGVYCHLVTLQPPKGKPVTMLYTGSAQQGLLDGSKSELGIGMRLSGYSNTEGKWISFSQGAFGVEHDDFRTMMGKRHEMSDHGLFSYPILEDDLLEYKEHLEDKKLAPFDMKREEWKGWKVVNSAWWVAIGETRFDHFRAVCGGDEDAADLLMPIVMSNRGSFDKTTTTDMSEGMTYLNEGFVMFYSGVAPDRLGSGGSKEVMQDIREAKKKDRTNGTNIWVDPPEGYKWLTGNLRITAFERQGRPAHDAQARQKYRDELASVSTACKVPITKPAIKKWLEEQKAWEPMPATLKGYNDMSLPDLTHKESHTKPVLTRLEKLLVLCNFNSQGMSKKIQITMSRPLIDGPNKGHKGLEIFPWSGANWWRDAVADVLSRNTGLSKTDATSYVPRGRGATPHVQSTFVPSTWSSTQKVSIQLLELDRHGLIPADLTGFKLIQWDLSGKIVGELQRKHGDDYLGKEWDLYAEVGAALRIALALARKHVPNKNRGAFLQAPAAWNVISPPHKVAVVPSYDPADLACGHERFLKVLQAYTDESEGEEEEEDRPYMLVNWLPLPCSRSGITERGLYQAALECLDMVKVAGHQRYAVIVRSSWWTCGFSVGDYVVYRIAKPEETRLAGGVWTIFYQGVVLDEGLGQWIQSKLFDDISDSATMQTSGVFVRFDPIALPNTRQTTNEQVWLIRTSQTPGGVEKDPRFSLRGPTATIMLPIGNADDDVLVGDALLVDRGKVDAQPTPLSRWQSLQQALTNWQAARSLTTDPVNDHPDADLVLALDSRTVDNEWTWPTEVTLHHLVCVVAAIAVLPWYDFSQQLIEDVLDHWDEDKEIVQLEPEALETLRLACSLIPLEEQAMLLLSFARQNLSVLVNTPSSRWILLPAARNTFIVLGSVAFKVMRGDGKVTTGRPWDKVKGILVFTVESGGSGFTVRDNDRQQRFDLPTVQLPNLHSALSSYYDGQIETTQQAIFGQEEGRRYYRGLPSDSSLAPTTQNTHVSRSSAGMSIVQRRFAIMKQINEGYTTFEPIGMDVDAARSRGGSTSSQPMPADRRVSQLSGQLSQVSLSQERPAPLSQLAIDREFTPPRSQDAVVDLVTPPRQGAGNISTPPPARAALGVMTPARAPAALGVSTPARAPAALGDSSPPPAQSDDTLRPAQSEDTLVISTPDAPSAQRRRPLTATTSGGSVESSRAPPPRKRARYIVATPSPSTQSVHTESIEEFDSSMDVDIKSGVSLSDDGMDQDDEDDEDDDAGTAATTYTLEKIVGWKVVDGEHFYHIKFEGYPEPEWHPERYIDGTADGKLPRIIVKYHEKYGGRESDR